MSRVAVLKWGLATVVFVAIGLAAMRYGHGVGLVLLVAALLVVFALDLGARRREGASSPPQPDVTGDAGRTDGPLPMQSAPNERESA